LLGDGLPPALVVDVFDPKGEYFVVSDRLPVLGIGAGRLDDIENVGPVAVVIASE
jgi:hypothetical protein